MTAHRYWRLYISDNNDPSGGPGSNRWHTSLIELEMFATPGGANQCTGGTAIASSDYVGAGWTKNNAFDGVKNNDVGWSANNTPPPVWIGYDFGSGNEKDIVEFAITARQTSVAFGQHPKDCILQFSDDGLFWYDTTPISNQTGWTYNQTRTFSVAPYTPNVYLQSHFREVESINVEGLGSDSQIRGTFTGDAEISGTVSIESEPIQNAVVRLVDAETGTCIRQTLSNISGHYEFLNVKRSGLYDVIAEDPDQLWEKKVSSRRSPFHRSLIKSKQFSGQSARFNFTKAIPYRYFKLNISANGSGDPYINIGAIRLTGDGYENLCKQYGGTWSQSSAYSAAYESNQAFLEVPGSLWHSASESAPFHAQWDFGSGNAHGVDVLGITYAGCCNRYPYDFTFEGSNDGSTWTTLGTWTGQTGYTLNVMKFFAL